MAPGDLMAQGSLVSVAVCLGKWDCGGLALDSCGVQVSVALTRGKGLTACGWWNLLVSITGHP